MNRCRFCHANFETPQALEDHYLYVNLWAYDDGTPLCKEIYGA